jgi:beta-glucosidase
MAETFLFTTGIENSYPTLPDGTRVDQMAQCQHTTRWEEDFALVRELGVQALRYGPAYYLTHLGADRYDWDPADAPMVRLRSLGIEVIADLCHFGVPDWLGGFQDPAFPVLFAEYARTFARRYPWVRYYTPVNEIFVCASFSALRGWWNECEQSDRAFVHAIRNMCMAHELAVEAILSERPDAVIVQSESLEYFHERHESARAHVEHWNALRFLALDLTLGHSLAPGVAAYLHEHGVPSHELTFFRERRAVGQRWLGTDFYPTCEHAVAQPGEWRTMRRGKGYRRLATEYWERYGIPLFHCETNRTSTVASRWLTQQWNDVTALRVAGIPVHGFTWYSLTDQIDWHHALRVRRDEVHPVGLYDLARRPRPVARAFRALIAQHQGPATLQQKRA